MDISTLKNRLSVVEGQIADFDNTIAQAGRSDKTIQFREITVLYKEQKYLLNRIGILEGTVKKRTYAKNGGRGFV